MSDPTERERNLIETVGAVRRGDDAQFEYLQFNPGSWRARFISLDVGAEVLVKAMLSEISASNQLRSAIPSTPLLLHGWHPTLLLCGTALEVGLKAVHLTDLAGQRPSDRFFTHNLPVLSEIARFEVNGPEQRLLEILTEWLIFLGRYPTPTERQRDRMPTGCAYGEYTLDVYREVAVRLHLRLAI